MANARLRVLDATDKHDIISAVTAAAEKKFLAAAQQKGENYTDMNALLYGRRMQIGELVYDTALTAAEKRLLAKHPAWFKKAGEIQFVAWDGTRKHKMNLPMADERHLPTYLIRDSWNDDPDENRPVYFDALSAVSIAVRELETLENEHRNTMRNVELEITRVLAGRTNAKQAMERWPELEHVYPKIKELVVEASQQLSVITTTLDATFIRA